MANMWVLRPESELRVDVPRECELRLQLVSGTAEIFGFELPRAEWLTFPPAHKFAVFSWGGATIEVNGPTDSIYIAAETPMQCYSDVHSMINKKRAQAADEAFPCGPKILVAGPTDSGKSSLAKMLLGWATKKQYKPMFIDLDPGQNSITIPGTLAATFVEEPVDPVNGIVLKAPIAYFFGHTSPSGNPYLYKLLVREIANASISELRKERESEVRSSGIIINTMGWVQDLGYELLLHTIKSFNVDVVLVLGQEELQKNLLDQFKGIDILYVPKSEGVVTRDKRLRHFTRTSKIKEYFFGVSNNLSPHQHSIKFNDIKIFEFSIPDGNDTIHPVPVMITRELVSSILAVTYARGPHQLISSIIAGFIYVTNVDLRSNRLWYMAPCADPLPNRILLKGSIVFRDQS